MGKYTPLTRYLASSTDDRVVLSFAAIEEILGTSLPASARRHAAFWANTSSYARVWRDAGFRATSRGVPAGHMGFVREAPQGSRPGGSAASEPRSAEPSSPSVATCGATAVPSATATLVGCVKSKVDEPRPARDLYTSPLFLRRRAYAEGADRPWFVLSARYGIVDPGEVIEPYDLTVAMMSPAQREVWGRQVVADLRERFGPLDGKVFDVHAGEAYRKAVLGPLRAAGATIVAPLAGLPIGEQLRWVRRAPAWSHYDGRGLGTCRTRTGGRARDGPRHRAGAPPRALQLRLARCDPVVRGWLGVPRCRW